jgi:phosphate transport system permease protein
MTVNGHRLELKKRKKLLSSDRIMPIVLAIFAGISILTTIGIVIILLTESAGFFRQVPLLDFLFGTKWTPLFAGSQQAFGVLPLVAGTLMITGIASLVALPIGLFSGIYLSEYAPAKVRAVLKPLLEILAGIPTIVYGFFALTFVTPLLQKLIPELSVFNALSAGLVVGIMIIPMISSLSEDAMSAVPRSIRDAAYALGATRFEVALKVVVPAALSGIVASFVLGLSRAIGETMIVAMASGGLANLTWNPLESMQTLTAYIVMVANGDTSHGSVEYYTIYAVGMVLFVMTLVMNLLAGYIKKKFREEYR